MIVTTNACASVGSGHRRLAEKRGELYCSSPNNIVKPGIVAPAARQRCTQHLLRHRPLPQCMCDEDTMTSPIASDMHVSCSVEHTSADGADDPEHHQQHVQPI